jgi:hypothetical protein
MRHGSFLPSITAGAICVLLRLAPVLAQTPQPGRLRGIIHTRDRVAVAGVNVFILETLEGALTGSDGRFAISTAQEGTLTLLVKRLGFENIRRVVTPSERDSIDIVLTRSAVSLLPVNVQAGSYTANEERGATLTPLEVVTTPGTAADVNRAIQTLPGVQAVDEGTALFVRGGDYTETKVFLNEAPLLNPVQLLSPTGTFVGTVDPFLLDGIFFSSGGFGARYGDALSAVAGLHTRGPVTRTTATVGAGLAAFSADIGLPVTRGLSVRAAANHFDLRPFLDINGSVRRYSPPPHGRDVTGSVIWNYRQGAELKLLAIDQTNSLGVGVDDPAFSDAYDLDVRSQHAVLNWRHVVRTFVPAMSFAQSRLRKGESFGALQLTTDLVRRQLFSHADWQANATAIIRFGGELESLASTIDGSLPKFRFDARPGARTRVVTFDRTGHRTGTFAELDWRFGAHWRLIPGLRTDYSSLTKRHSIDPRLNAAFRATSLLTLTGAWGIYHQVPDPLFFADSLAAGVLAPMRANQLVVGLQLGEENLAFRMELYEKRYRHLVQLTRDHATGVNGRGRSRGMDLFFRAPMPFGFQSRSIVTLLSARRTDPNSGILARAPYDITSSQTFILDRTLGDGIRLGAAYRAATGRPITPIMRATYDAAHDVYIPEYGTPWSERLPGFRRIDLSLSQYRPIANGWSRVLYFSLSNVLDRRNIYDYRYSRDYAQRFPVRSVFNRAVYVGASLLRQ